MPGGVLVTLLGPGAGAALAPVRARLLAEGLRAETVPSGAADECVAELCVPDVAPEARLLGRLRAALAAAVPDVDVAVTPAAVRDLPRLVVLDVDSTLITGEVIEMLAAHAGREAEVAAVTEAAMRGELDFTASLHARVAELAGLPVQVLDDVRAAVVLTDGAVRLARELADRGVPVGVVSGGFAEVVEPLARDLGIPHVRANRLEAHGGRLTGRVQGPVVDPTAKETFLRELADAAGAPMAGTVAVGDGANDALMVTAAGIGVAFCAKPYLAERADVVLRHRDLTSALRLVTGPATG